jgi:hypothetical protein
LEVAGVVYREVGMWEILNVLKRVGGGESRSAVARVTGHTRKTFGRYVVTAESLGWRPGIDELSNASQVSTTPKGNVLRRASFAY